MAKQSFSWKDKHRHYTKVANGEAPVKTNSQFPESEQRAYARGQRDARNEANRITAIKNATPAQKQAYKETRAVQNALRKMEKR